MIIGCIRSFIAIYFIILFVRLATPPSAALCVYSQRPKMLCVLFTTSIHSFPLPFAAFFCWGMDVNKNRPKWWWWVVTISGTGRRLLINILVYIYRKMLFAPPLLHRKRRKSSTPSIGNSAAYSSQSNRKVSGLYILNLFVSRAKIL